MPKFDLACKPRPVQLAPAPVGFRLTRPGSRYAIHPRGEEHRGTWVPDGVTLPAGWTDAFSDETARALLPLLRDLDGRAAGKGGRRGAEPTTPDGKLVARVCKRLGLTAAALAEAIGAHESVLSRARHGDLPEKHRRVIAELMKKRG